MKLPSVTSTLLMSSAGAFNLDPSEKFVCSNELNPRHKNAQIHYDIMRRVMRIPTLKPLHKVSSRIRRS